jgi:EAL domain-containing protein (putative c-di-GMP-specific phosphodiesterase class I)
VLRRQGRRHDVLFTGFRFPDGDAFELIRRLSSLESPPALFFISNQQRAVVRAAQTLCEHYGLIVVGHTEGSSSLNALLEQVRRYQSEPAEPFPHLRPSAPPMDIRALDSLIINDAIRTYLQPKVRLSSCQVIGFESLMRAIDPQGRVLGAPAIIEPLAAAGLLPAATLQLVRQTLAFLMQCFENNLGVGVSINVPLSLISDREFCELMHEQVVGEGIDTSWITIEITESEAMAEPAEVLENAARIRMYGFNLSIDDIGTAYSSLAQLTKIPFSELKIERSFVSGIDKNKANQAVVAACTQLGRSLGLHVVAEGVERPEELAAVRDAGCTEVQGFLISKPMEVAQALAWLRGLDHQIFPLPQAPTIDLGGHL